MDCSSTCDVRVTGGGDQVAAHGGLWVLGRFADALGLGEALSSAVPPRGERAPSHDPGKVLVHALLMFAAEAKQARGVARGLPEPSVLISRGGQWGPVRDAAREVLNRRGSSTRVNKDARGVVAAGSEQGGEDPMRLKALPDAVKTPG